VSEAEATRTPAGGLRVALTFDAEHPSRIGSRPGTVETILDVLARERVSATFFVQGRWASAHPATAARIPAEGHLVGSHSHYHAPMPLLSEEGFGIDVRRAEERIAEATGVDPRPWFRCPFGDGADRPAVLDRLRALGYRNVHWDVSSGDWEAGPGGPEPVERAVLSGVGSAGDGAVVLFHTWPAATAAALPGIVRALRAEGASFVTVAEVDRAG
jgi:peptidoglycan-N-acetylglucosamine deacetylase